MNKLTQIDKNFALDTNIQKEGIKFYNCMEEPFIINGVIWENGYFMRMPEKAAKAVSDGVDFLNKCTSGGRVRFKTNSPYVAIYARTDEFDIPPHFALSGTVGFDMYIKNEKGNLYSGTFMPDANNKCIREGIREIEEDGIFEVILNMPLYGTVKELYIGLDENAVLEKADDYKITKPVVFYGSSITQGGCASRAGRCYTAIVSRKFEFDYINLGFSGSAKAEQAMIDYINSLDMSVFVYDYDHNAPDPDYLKATHENMFKQIRKAHPDLPIIIMAMPNYYLTDDIKKRREVIETTYNNALSAGDKNVYYLSGTELMALAKGEGSVDCIHPTDFGFASMAQALSALIERENII